MIRRSDSVLELRRSVESRLTFAVVFVLLLAAGYVGINADNDLAATGPTGTILFALMGTAAGIAALGTRRTMLDTVNRRIERRVALAGLPVGPVHGASIREAVSVSVIEHDFFKASEAVERGRSRNVLMRPSFTGRTRLYRVYLVCLDPASGTPPVNHLIAETTYGDEAATLAEGVAGFLGLPVHRERT